MSRKVSTISWIWDHYGARYTEVRKAINSTACVSQIPTENRYFRISPSVNHQKHEFTCSIK